MADGRLWIVGYFLLLMGSVSAVSVCIDNSVPSAPGNLSVSGEVGSILISWSAAVDEPDCSGIAEYIVSRNGVELSVVDSRDSEGRWSFVDDANLGEGEYNYTVYAVDLVGGNAGASVRRDVVVERGVVRSGGGLGSYVCDADWSCGEWSECVGRERMRICEDLNGCDTSYLKPEGLEKCGDGVFEDVEDLELVVAEDETEGFFSAITGAVVGGGAGSGVAVGTLFLLVGAGAGLVIWRRR